MRIFEIESKLKEMTFQTKMQLSFEEWLEKAKFMAIQNFRVDKISKKGLEWLNTAYAKGLDYEDAIDELLAPKPTPKVTVVTPRF